MDSYATTGEDVEKLIKFGLVRTFDEIAEEENDVWKEEDAVTDKVRCRLAGIFEKFLRKNNFI
jgi:hypothetical protein